MTLRDKPAEWVGQSERVLGIGVNDEGGEVFDRGGRLVVDSGKGNVETGPLGSRRS